MRHRIPPGTAHRVVAPVRTDPDGVGGPTRRQASGPEWRRSSHGLYVPSDVELTPAQRVLEAGYLVPRCGAVTGWGSLHWQGATWFTGTRADGTLVDVDIAVPAHRIRTQAGFHMTGDRFDPAEAVSLDGIWVAWPVPAAFFAMRYAPSVTEAALVLAMAAFDDLVSVEEMTAHALDHPAYTGVPRCRDALPRAVENCWSPQEFRMLTWWEDAGFPSPLANRPVFDLAGRHIGTPDLIDPVAGVIGQYDGGVHLVGDAPRADAVRDAAFEHHGLEQVTARAGDLGGRFVSDLRSAYARAAARPQSDRTWTTELPGWWVPTFTVEQRRALSAADRERWLGYRAA
ncbi:hypothetical protein [Nocardioides rubriscoriae]|uniref:hypothetical protein n=1 Tax=Nocardioides rubriscoriae TaxID=642762 RepID=UPI0011E0262F|nr:hypothetical protein [Nocardioides rubriscoriae]